MTSRTLLLPILLLLALFYACGKGSYTSTSTGNPQDTSHSNENKYVPAPVLLVDDLVLYTSNGAYRDTHMIKEFMTRNFPNQVKWFNYGQTVVSDPVVYVDLVFLDSNKVKLNSMLTEIVSKSDTEMMLAKPDSNDMPGKDFEQLGKCGLLYAQVPQYNPYSICRAAGGNCKKFRMTYPVIISGKDYYIPIINYAVVSNCKIFRYTSLPMPNYFNKEILNGMLQNKDSVLVQISRLPLVKQP